MRQHDRVEDRPARGRPGPVELVYSVAQVLCCGKDEAEIAERAAAIGREVAELRENGLAGTPAEVVDKLGAFAERAAPSGSTCRCSTSPTSTTCGW